MDPTYINALSALGGTVVGALSSFSTTWLTTHAQNRSANLRAQISMRQDLYGRFMDELASMLGKALKSDAVDWTQVSTAYALKGRIIVVSSPDVAAKAEEAIKFVVGVMLAPIHTDEEIAQSLDTDKLDIIGDFARLCRAEIERLH